MFTEISKLTSPSTSKGCFFLSDASDNIVVTFADRRLIRQYENTLSKGIKLSIMHHTWTKTPLRYVYE